MASGDSFRRQMIDRNRLNQRNFRARRQAYIQELEQRIRKLENDGVRATQEVQVAAQQVVKENRLLRLLLETRFGVDADKISKYLSEIDDATDIYRQRSLRIRNKVDFSRVPKDAASSLVLATNSEEALRARTDSSFIEPTCPHEERQRDFRISPKPPDHDGRSPTTPSTNMDTPQPAEIESHIPLSNHQLLTTLETSLPTRHPTRDGEYEAGFGHSCCLHPMSKCLRGVGAASEERTDTHAGETSCEEAARIIASLRGQNTCDDVWDELGCGTNQTCRVKNLSVFELLDKE